MAEKKYIHVQKGGVYVPYIDIVENSNETVEDAAAKTKGTCRKISERKSLWREKICHRARVPSRLGDKCPLSLIEVYCVKFFLA